MPFVAAVRSHFERSFSDTLTWMFGFVENRPKFLRPAFYGAFFIWALILFRGGLIVLPIALPILFFTNRPLLWQLLLVFVVLAPAGGFMGGLLYGLTEPVLGWLGRFGKILQFILGTWVYCAVLVFFIMPIIDAKEMASTSTTENWLISAGMGVVFGLAIGISATSADRVPNPATSRRITIGVVIVGAILIIAMKVAGWW